MAMRTVYGTQAAGAQVPGSTLDAIFADIFGLAGTTQCTATGTNAITLSPLANQAVVATPTPANAQLFSFVAAANSTGAVTVQVGAGSALPLFLPGGTVQATAGSLLNAGAYLVQFLSALNSAAGGYVIVSGIQPLQSVNAQTGTTYAIAQTDLGKTLTFSNAGAIAASIAQASAAGSFPAGWWCELVCLAASVGAVTLTPTTSTVDALPTLVILPGQSVKIFSDGANYQVSRGTGLLNIIGNTETGVANTGSTTMPGVNTVPTNANGDQYMTLTVTPQNPNSTLFVDVVWNGTNSLAVNHQTALYQDATVNALASIINVVAGAGGGIITQSFRHRLANNVASGVATTFKVRSGPTSAATTTFNGSGGAQSGGGTFASSITVWEKLP